MRAGLRARGRHAHGAAGGLGVVWIRPRSRTGRGCGMGTSSIAIHTCSPGRPDVMDRDHVRVRQPGERLRLASQPRRHATSSPRPGRTSFQRHLAIELRIVRRVNDPSPLRAARGACSARGGRGSASVPGDGLAPRLGSVARGVLAAAASSHTSANLRCRAPS